MYEYKKRPSKIKKVIILIVLMLIVAATAIFIYDMYINIDVYSTEEEHSSSQAIRVSYKENDNTEGTEESITNMLQSTIKSVVGISKIKNSGSSIFLNNSTYSLGLRNWNNCFRKWVYTYKLACSR